MARCSCYRNIGTCTWRTIDGRTTGAFGRDRHHVTCDACGRWLPLGPSNDDDERVRIEIRAAELALQPRGSFTTSDVQSGWVCAAKDYDPPPWPHCPDAWAGWLAYAIIHDHDAEGDE